MINQSLQDFFDITNQTHLLLSVVLILVVATLVLPNGIYSVLGKILVLTILGYILYRNITETRRLMNAKNKNPNTEMKTNALVSYILCFFIMLLFTYMAYTLIY
jgi:hypothetical protein